MSRCLAILLRFLLAELSTRSFVLCTIKQTTCRYPRSPASLARCCVDNHRAGNHFKAQTTDGHHLFCPAEHHWSAWGLFLFPPSARLPFMSLMPCSCKVQHERGAPCRDKALCLPQECVHGSVLQRRFFHTLALKSYRLCGSIKTPVTQSDFKIPFHIMSHKCLYKTLQGPRDLFWLYC